MLQGPEMALEGEYITSKADGPVDLDEAGKDRLTREVPHEGGVVLMHLERKTTRDPWDRMQSRIRHHD
jgi:hypothetical protein